MIRKEELVAKGLEVYLDGQLLAGVEECDPQNGWVRVRMSRKPNSGLTPNLCIKRRGKVELRPKAPKLVVEIGVIKPKSLPQVETPMAEEKSVRAKRAVSEEKTK